jgi:DNA replication and repair protein RecF
MLQLTNITLTQFRNYVFRSFEFTERITGIYGLNGSGKTNLLDAIYYLCFTRSYFSRTDAQSVHHGLQGMRIEGHLRKNNQEEKLVCIVRENNRKEFQVSDEPYKKFSDHIGRYPCVMIAPDDTELITGGSEERRRFMDTILSQLSPNYLQQLIDYNKILQQRNSLLKAAAEHQRLDTALLDILDEQLVDRGTSLFNQRLQFIDTFIPYVQQQYLSIAGKDDEVQLQYDSQLHGQSFHNLLQQNRQRDLYLQRTGIGIHKDDLNLTMNGQPFKSLASQGQRKSLLFAIKLAEFLILKAHKGFAPLLLLDDVFEKLDATRMHNLLHKVCVEEQGQVFITDTHKERLQTAFEQLGLPCGLIEASER